MSPRRAPLVFWLTGLTCLPSLVACRGATQIEVEVTTDIKCADYGSTTIAVGRLGSIDPTSPATHSSACEGAGRVGSLVIVPSGSNDEPVAFEVTGGVGVDPTRCSEPEIAPKCIVARRSLRFIPHETLRVSLPLRGECQGIPCTAVSTCVHGACVPATIEDPSQCKGAGCDEGSLPGGAVDAGAPDAALDATLDANGGDAATDGGSDGATTAVVKEMALGLNHSCALMTDTSVTCWGADDNGQLGMGDAGPNVVLPQRVPGLTGIKAISAFSEGNVAVVLANDTVMMWGANDNAQLGDPARATVPSASPIPVPGLASVGSVAIGRANACALGTDRTSLRCWGAIAAPDFVLDKPTAIGGVSGTVKKLIVGDNLVTLHMDDGTVRTLGANYSGTNGTGDFDGGVRTAAGPVPGLEGAVEMATGNVDILVRLADGGVVGWGANVALELGIDNFQPYASPTVSAGLGGLTGIVIGDIHACGLRGTQVVCWGDNQYKQLGTDSILRTATPQVVQGLPPATKLWAGWAHTCARVLDGTIYCWGKNDYGELGDGSTGSRAQPRAVKF